jgi:hypothetical protein
MKSPGHRANILGHGITHMGVAVAKGFGTWEYATQVTASGPHRVCHSLTVTAVVRRYAALQRFGVLGLGSA